MSSGLLCGDEPGAHPHTVGSGCHHPLDVLSTADAAGREDGHVQLAQARLEERHQLAATVVMTPCLDSLRDDQVAPRSHCSSGPQRPHPGRRSWA